MPTDGIHHLFQQIQVSILTERQELREKIHNLAKQIGSSEAFVGYLANDHYLVRQYAAEALGIINHETCVQPLVHLLEHEENKQVQMAAVYALEEISTFSALEALLKIAASTTLTKLVQALAVQSVPVSIFQLLIRPNFDILQEAVSRKNSEVVESVFDAFQTLDEYVPAQVLELLQAGNTPDSIKLYMIDYLGKRRYAPALDTILPFLDSEDLDFQHAAVTALGDLGIPQAIIKLEAKREDEDEILKFRVEEALKKLKVSAEK